MPRTPIDLKRPAGPRPPAPSAPAADVAIVGGGIMGSAIALRLAQRGLRVTVIERGIPGAEASSAAAGILGPQMEAEGPGPLLDLGLRSRALYPALEGINRLLLAPPSGASPGEPRPEPASPPSAA